MDKDEDDQLKKETGTIREGQQQALEEQWMKIEEKLIHKQENIVKISKEDIINVNNVIEKKIQEKDVEEKARKDRKIIWLILSLKKVKQ